MAISSTRKQTVIELGDYKLSQKKHDALVQYAMKRVEAARSVRDLFVDKIEIVDREIAGYIELGQDDKKRKKDNNLGKGPKTTDINLQVVLTQLDEAVTFLLSVLAPDEGMYGAIAEKEKQDVANGFASLLNVQAVFYQHYRQYAKSFLDMLKYNIGGHLIEWQNTKGNRLANAAGGTVDVKNETVMQGNSIEALDMYNFIWDISVKSMVDIPNRAEFFATVDAHTEFRVRKMEADGEIYGIDRFIDKQSSLQYYKDKPVVHEGKFGGSNGTDFVSILSAGTIKELQAGHEFINMYIWLVPSKFGLSKSTDMEIWRLTIAHGQFIVAVEHLGNAHGMLPCAIGMPIEDGLELQTHSFGETLLPLQRFISNQFNVKQRADRKSLYGLTIYDANVIPLMETADLEGGKIPAKPVGQDKDLRRSIMTINDAPDTTGTMRDIAAVNDLMQKMLPTDIAKQVAGLERATQYQAAATVQGSNRRNLKIAKVIYDQALSRVRFMLMYNVFQYQETMEILDNERGEVIEINPAQFRDARIEFTISDGLKGIDKLLVIESLRDVINMMLQSQVASAQVDIVAIIDYWLNMAGDKLDFKQFKYKSEMDKLPPEQRDLAFQLLQAYMQQQQQMQQGGGAAPQQMQQLAAPVA